MREDALAFAREYIGIVVGATGIPARIIATILAAEHNDVAEKWPTVDWHGIQVPTNNPADISGMGSEPVYHGAIAEASNGVTIYDTLENGAMALAHLLLHPPVVLDLAPDWVALTQSNPREAIRAFAHSNFASSHYGATTDNPDGDLWGVYESPAYEPLWAEPDGSPTATPQPAAPPSGVKGYTLHTVRPGDTLSGLAAMFRSTVQAIVAANPIITNPDMIQVGWKLRIPILG